MSARKYLPEKVRRGREEVAEIAERLEGRGLIVAGSWRRGKDTVGDLDILVPGGQYHSTIEWAEQELGYVEMRAGVTSQGTCILGDELLLLNFWKVPSTEAWGGMLLFASGPMELNIAMRARAMGLGWMLNQYGLFHGSEQLDDGTEAHIFELLGYQWLGPLDREDWRKRLRLKAADVKAVRVPTSDGSGFYTVTLKDGLGWDCECRGFSFRGRCRHLAEAEAAR